MTSTAVTDAWIKGLRPYQRDAVDYIFDYVIEHERGRLLAVAPPAAGKSVILAAFLLHAVKDGGLKALVVAHRREIVEQLYKHMLRTGLPEETVGVIMSTDRRIRPEAPIQVASIDTIRRRSLPHVDIVVTDESHRDAGDSRRKLRRYYADAFQLGFTASPCRMDGRGLDDDYDELKVMALYGELLLGGWIVAPRVFTVPDRFLPDLRGVRLVGGEYEGRGLARAMMSRGLVGNIVDHWQAHAKDMSTVVFAVSIKHSIKIVDAFRLAGVRASHLDESTPDTVRKKILDDFEYGRIDVLSCVNLLSEGWDCPRCKCVVMARPTMSLNLHLQQSGRCMRPWESVTPIVLDHAGNMRRHSLPYLDRDWQLTSSKKQASASVTPVRVCENCLAVLHAALVMCSECGHARPRTDVLEEDGRTLVEVSPSFAERESDKIRIRAFAAGKGLSEAWADTVFRAKYGNVSS